MTQPDLDAVLDVRIESDDIGEVTLREYLQTLLLRLWTQKEGFGGKRPFGNSGWDFEIYEALIKSGFVEGSFDEDGYIEDVDTKSADKLVHLAIQHVFGSI